MPFVWKQRGIQTQSVQLWGGKEKERGKKQEQINEVSWGKRHIGQKCTCVSDPCEILIHVLK